MSSERERTEFKLLFSIHLHLKLLLATIFNSSALKGLVLFLIIDAKIITAALVGRESK